MGVTTSNAARRGGRIVVRADERSLTPYAGLAVSGELARRLRVAGLIDAELAVERRARPVKVRRRGLSPGELVVSLAECQLVGGAFFDHIEDVRGHLAGARLRAVAATPSAPAALQNAKRFRRCHVQRIERAMARAGQRLDKALGRDPAEAVTVDLDATQVTVYGQRKQGAGRQDANRLWLTAALLALNITAFCCDLCPAAGASGKAPDDAPLRRTAATLRRILFNIPARIIRSARRTILRLPEGFRHADIFQATLDAVYALPPP